MNIETCMSKDVRIASPAQSIRDAARMMKEIDAGFLPVGENNRLVGTVTDRDIAVRGVAEGKGPDTPVRDVMTGEVLYCFEDEDLDAVSTKMGHLQVRRLPVLIAKSTWSGSFHSATSRRSTMRWSPVLRGRTQRHLDPRGPARAAVRPSCPRDPKPSRWRPARLWQPSAEKRVREN
jgi:predicted transcriptional regulator